MKILCFGDSNTFGFNPEDGSRYPQDVRWSGILKNNLRDNAKVVEAGCNNRTCIAENPSGEMYTSYRIFPKLLKDDFTHIIIGVGINDLQKVYDISLQELEKGLESLIIEAKEMIPNVKIILLSPSEIKDSILNSGFKILFDESSILKSKGIVRIYKNLADRYGCCLLDLNKVVEVSDIDGLHYFSEEHKKIAESILKLIG